VAHSRCPAAPSILPKCGGAIAPPLLRPLKIVHPQVFFFENNGDKNSNDGDNKTPAYNHCSTFIKT
jgi:hypothetical protein